MRNKQIRRRRNPRYGRHQETQKIRHKSAVSAIQGPARSRARCLERGFAGKNNGHPQDHHTGQRTYDAVLRVQGTRHHFRARQARYGRQPLQPQRHRGHRDSLRRLPCRRIRGHQRLPRMSCAPLRRRVPQKRNLFRPSAESAHRQEPLRRMRTMRQGVPVQRDSFPPPPLRKFLQGESHLNEREQGGEHQQRQVHRVRRVRISMSFRRDNRQVLYSRRHRYDKEEREQREI